MSFDYIAQARLIVNQLNDCGFEDWSSRVNEVFDSASTGTELLMGVRWNLLQLIESDSILPPELKSQVENFVSQANLLLK